jgi:hypothetical protein
MIPIWGAIALIAYLVKKLRKNEKLPLEVSSLVQPKVTHFVDMDKNELQKKITGYYTGQKYRFSNVEEIHQDENWKRGVATVNNLCDYFGYKTAGIGSVHFVLFIHSDDLADEAAIGKCRLLLDALAIFRKYALRFGWRKQPVTANVFFIFNNSDKAFHFRKSVLDHCRFTHNALLSNEWVLPFGIDVSARSVWGQKKLVSFGDNKFNEIEAALFS